MDELNFSDLLGDEEGIILIVIELTKVLDFVEFGVIDVKYVDRCLAVRGQKQSFIYEVEIVDNHQEVKHFLLELKLYT